MDSGTTTKRDGDDDDAYSLSNSSAASSDFDQKSLDTPSGEWEVFHLPEQFAIILLHDEDLPSLYGKASSKRGTTAFRQQHDVLLTRFFADLKNHYTGPTQEWFEFLRMSKQRREITEWVIQSTLVELPRLTAELERMTIPGERQLNEYLKENYEFLPPLRGEQEESNSEISRAKGLRSTGESGGEAPPSILGTLFVGQPFEAFKRRVLCLSKPDLSIEDALDSQDVNILTDLLEQRFDEVASGSFPWISDLRAAGLRRREIAEILHSSEHDAPWIFFDPSPRISENWESADRNSHYENCSHSIVPQSIELDPFSRVRRVRAGMSGLTVQPQPEFQISYVQRFVEELCGLGGVVPDSRDFASWNGRAVFEGHGRVSISYLMDDPDHPELDTPAQVALRLHRVSMRVLAAVALLQKAQLCCTSFTFMGLTEKNGSDQNMATLRNISVQWVTSLEQSCREAAESQMPLNYEEETLECQSLGVFSFMALSKLRLQDSIPFNYSPAIGKTNREHLHVASLELQLLCVGLLSYVQAHIGCFRPFFLDREVDKMLLLGLRPGVEVSYNYHIEARLVDLSCLAGMTGNKVFILAPPMSLSKLDDTQRLDVSGTPEDILDTWGPGQVICRQNSENTPVAIVLAGGFIFPVRSNDGAVAYHWAQELDIRPDSPALNMKRPIVVGTQVKVNQNCCNYSQKDTRRKEVEGCLFDLGTESTHWEMNQQQFGLQAGFHAMGMVNLTRTKMPGINIKTARLQQTMNHQDLVDFLGCLWGVRVSCCTGVAQRVLLQHLAGDLLPIFAKAETNRKEFKTWKELHEKHQVFERLQDVAGPEPFRVWLRTLRPYLHDFLLRAIRLLLCRLAATGLSADKRFFSVAWPSSQSLGACIRIPIRDDHTKWLPMLEDSAECATFAYMSDICLEAGGIQCQGSSWKLNHRIPMLETSVHCPEQHGQWNLSNGESYFFRNLDRELFWVKAEKDPQRLHENLPAILTALERFNNVPSRVANRVFERVRERKGRICERRLALTQSAEAAVVLSKKYQGQ